ncbi:AMIN-like domain-containing (lipo)protein [Streptomyces syringium]|uniref:AMIN-like domain-containing (lipo)protein n=1 Tax=Streptomyces syringium TaxID=76729 RepID=UPI0034234B3A
MRRWSTALAALLLAGAGLAATTASASASRTAAGTHPSSAMCEVGWGSYGKTGVDTSYKPLTDVRTGRHECFDRMVLDMEGAGHRPIGYRVGYVDSLHQDGSGDTIHVAGGAILEVRVAAPSYDPATGRATYRAKAGRRLPGVDVTGYRTFEDTRFAGSFEGDTQIGLGVRARLPFRVFQWDHRIVIDVAHRWGVLD